MTTTTALPFDAATFPIRYSKKVWIWETQSIAGVYLANLSNLNHVEISKSQRRHTLKVLQTLEQVLAHNNRLPLKAAQLVLLMALDRRQLELPVEEMVDVGQALSKTRQRTTRFIAEHIMKNPEKYANRYAKSAVELVAITEQATVGQVPYRLP
jgi:recombinational DNA repair ATPase RecF